MEKVTFNHENQRLTRCLGIPDERYDEITTEIDALVGNVQHNGVLQPADQGVRVCLSRLLEVLLNDVAKTEAERYFLMYIAPGVHHNIVETIREFADLMANGDDITEMI